MLQETYDDTANYPQETYDDTSNYPQDTYDDVAQQQPPEDDGLYETAEELNEPRSASSYEPQISNVAEDDVYETTDDVAPAPPPVGSGGPPAGSGAPRAVALYDYQVNSLT